MAQGIDVSSLSVNNPYSTLFGGSSSSSSSSSLGWMSGLNDLNMINRGVYKKALNKMVEQEKAEKDADSISKSGSTDSEMSLSNLKSNATNLYKATKELRSTDFDSASDEDIEKKLQSFVNSYNSTLNTTKNLNSYGILQTAVWATEKVGYSEGLLNQAGITVNDDNTLSLDKDKLKAADKSTLKTLFSGSGSFVDQMNQKASALVNQATNQLASNTGRAIYSSSATLV